MTEQLSDSPPPSSGKTQLMIGAIILLIFAAIAWLYSVADVIFRFYTLSRGQIPPKVAEPGYAAGFYGAMYGLIGMDILTLLLAPVLIFAAVQMLRTRKYGFCRTGAILAMLPVTTNCCCIITLPIGIWLLVVLNRPDMKVLFDEAVSR